MFWWTINEINERGKIFSVPFFCAHQISFCEPCFLLAYEGSYRHSIYRHLSFISVACFRNGYPDPGYLRRVKQDLAAKGICWFIAIGHLSFSFSTLNWYAFSSSTLSRNWSSGTNSVTIRLISKFLEAGPAPSYIFFKLKWLPHPLACFNMEIHKWVMLFPC